MRTTLFQPPWSAPEEPPVLRGYEEVLDGAWTEAATEYAADWIAKQNTGRRGPVGVQKYLNKVLDRRFIAAGWSAYASTYIRNNCWLRITFRHQMSAGANIVDALKAGSKNGYGTLIIAAATREFLDLISAADAPALTSFEKLHAELVDLEGVISVPILLAALEPTAELTGTVRNVIRSPSRRRLVASSE